MDYENWFLRAERRRLEDEAATSEVTRHLGLKTPLWKESLFVTLALIKVARLATQFGLGWPD